MRSVLKVKMHCIGCEKTLENEISRLDGVKNVKANYVENQVIVDFNERLINLNKIKEKLEEIGYETDAKKNLTENNKKKTIFDIFKR
ncbi:MAG: cation transporter [Candidatus Micrarchaeota archaeon]|nr:cation transporter [Candidatus Micrarchaeota archaeon]